jgi:hypothetical protein
MSKLNSNKYATTLIQKWLNESDTTIESYNKQLNTSREILKEFPFLQSMSWAKLKKHDKDLFNAFYEGFIVDYFSKPENQGKIGKAIKIEGLENTADITPAFCLLKKVDMTKEMGKEVAEYLRHDTNGLMRYVDQSISRKDKGRWIDLQADFGTSEKLENSDNSGNSADSEDSDDSEDSNVVELSRLQQSAKMHWQDNTTLENSKNPKCAKPCSPEKVNIAKSELLKYCSFLLKLDDEKFFKDFKESDFRKYLNEL